MKKVEAPRILVAIDSQTIESAREVVAKLNPSLCRIKIGKTLFTRYGPSVVQEFSDQGFSIFLDLKFHDIPKQVAGAVRAAAELAVFMLTLHTSGGKEMMQAAVDAIADLDPVKRPLLLGVTILTSLDDKDIKAIGYKEEVSKHVVSLTKLAIESNLDGVVCSANEAELLRKNIGNDFLIVTPGIRIAGDQSQDQKRVMTPEKAFAAGADYLVIGRSITTADDPCNLLKNIAITSEGA